MRNLARLLLTLLLLFAAAGSYAAQTGKVPFDHLTTGFELEGKHRETPCESCHVNAVFKGTPRDCAACHAKGTRVNALPKPSGHILSSERCAACHTATTFAPAVRFDHAEALGNCASCHNGNQATGKPPGHIPTSEPCESCHKTSAWTPASFDHSGITGNCVSCHNGTKATGKNATHITTTDSCESCHRPSAWKPPTKVDHTQVTGTCFSCHNGATARGKVESSRVSSQSRER